MPIYKRPLRSDELAHHGTLGMKWGVKNGPPYPLSEATYSTSSPGVTDGKVTTYKKGTVIGRFGGYDFNNPTYFFTNETDRNSYRKSFGSNEHKFTLKKDLRIPTEIEQIKQLYILTGDNSVLDDFYDYWKDNINTADGKIFNSYMEHMKRLGYDGLVDSRNAGSIADDPILIFQPKRFCKKIKH